MRHCAAPHLSNILTPALIENTKWLETVLWVTWSNKSIHTPKYVILPFDQPCTNTNAQFKKKKVQIVSYNMCVNVLRCTYAVYHSGGASNRTHNYTNMRNCQPHSLYTLSAKELHVHGRFVSHESPNVASHTRLRLRLYSPSRPSPWANGFFVRSTYAYK